MKNLDRLIPAVLSDWNLKRLLVGRAVLNNGEAHLDIPPGVEVPAAVLRYAVGDSRLLTIHGVKLCRALRDHVLGKPGEREGNDG